VGATELRDGIITVFVKNATIEAFGSFFTRSLTVALFPSVSNSTEKFIEKQSTD
jgi:hypothetical protein